MNYESNIIKSCTDIEEQNDIYVFEIKIIYENKNSTKHRVICMNKIGELFSAENSIKKIKITLCILNSMEIIVLKKQFNKDIIGSVILHKENLTNYNFIIILNKINEFNINITYKIIKNII